MNNYHDKKIAENTEKALGISKKNKEKSKDILSLDPEGVVDVLDDGNKLVYLLADGQTTDKIIIDDVTYTPPSKNDLPYLLPKKEDVLGLINDISDISDIDLYIRLRDYHKDISDLPNELFYDLLVLWDFHTYLLDKLHFSPILYLYAVKERGKSRTGKGCLYVSRRGIFTETVREPDIIRWGNDHRAALGFDVKNAPKKFERANADDLILARFEKGSSSSRTLWPERGAFRDTKNFKLFGPTIIMTNRPVDDIFESRSISIDMKPTTRVFNDPVLPENALKLKAELAAFRFRHKDKVIALVNKPAGGRLGDILRPLLEVIQTFFPEKIQIFNRLVQFIAVQKKEEATDTFEAQVVDAVIRAGKQVADGFMTTELITSLFNEGKGERFAVTEKTIGRILRGLGFSKKRGTGGVRGIYYDVELVNKIALQYGLEGLNGGIYNTTSLTSLTSSRDTTQRSQRTQNSFDSFAETEREAGEKAVFDLQQEGIKQQKEREAQKPSTISTPYLPPVEEQLEAINERGDEDLPQEVKEILAR